MVIIPAIDLKDGRCVRLTRGREDTATNYSANPVAVAREWWRQGARTLHVVNLDGAFGRDSRNLEILRKMATMVSVAIHYGGGLRSLESMAEALEAGARRIVLGTIAVEEPALLEEALRQFGAERVIVALDARNGRVVTRGWKAVSDLPVASLAQSVRTIGVKEILYTDVARDGMLVGPDLDTLAALSGSGLRVIASGGIASVADVRAILSLGEGRISGLVVGKALYEGRLILRELIEVVEPGRKV